MSYVYKTKGTCSTQIEVDLDGNIVKNVKFTGGRRHDRRRSGATHFGNPLWHEEYFLRRPACKSSPRSIRSSEK